MNTALSIPRAQLEHAEVLLREVLVKDFESSQSDAKSLDQILTHLVNIQRAVADSPETHVNVAKRLADFADTSARLSARHPQSAVRLNELSQVLRAAGSGISASMKVTPAN